MLGAPTKPKVCARKELYADHMFSGANVYGRPLTQAVGDKQARLIYDEVSISSCHLGILHAT